MTQKPPPRVKPPDVVWGQLSATGVLHLFRYNPLTVHDNGRPVFRYRLDEPKKKTRAR